VTDLVGNQHALQEATLALQDASLEQLDGLLADRAGGQTRSRVVAVVAAVIGILVAAVLARLAWRWAPPRPPRRVVDPDDEPAGHRSANGTRVPVHAERSGGARAAR
jgi:hypothetical protein